MKIDILSFVALADQSAGLPFSRQTHSLGGAFDIVTPIDPVSRYGQWKHVKNVQGWPWDLKLYDEHYIYDWITEKDWTSGPRAFKKFIQNHLSFTGQLQDGVIMLPRFADSLSAGFNSTTIADQTTYATFENCLQVGPAISLGTISHHLRGPFLIDHAGDVGPQPTYIHQYYWKNNGVPTLEENYYALHYGWVAWKLQTLNQKTGLYETVQTTISNKLVAGTPQIVFPCF
jgi:hypothetical protein